MEFDTERGTKTKRGMEWENGRAFNPRMHATGDERCPVKHFTLYLSLRPLSASTPDSPIYLSVANNLKSNVWFQNQPIGVNTLGSFMKKMASYAGLTGKKTNHSAQKTMVTRLIQNEVHPLHIAQLSGHKNLSLDSSSVVSVDQQKAMSNIISSNRNQPPLVLQTELD